MGSLSPSGEVEEPLNHAVVDLCLGHDLHLISSTTGIDSPNGVIDGKDLFGNVADLRFKWKESAPIENERKFQ